MNSGNTTFSKSAIAMGGNFKYTHLCYVRRENETNHAHFWLHGSTWPVTVRPSWSFAVHHSHRHHRVVHKCVALKLKRLLVISQKQKSNGQKTCVSHLMNDLFGIKHEHEIFITVAIFRGNDKKKHSRWLTLVFASVISLYDDNSVCRYYHSPRPFFPSSILCEWIQISQFQDSSIHNWIN